MRVMDVRATAEPDGVFTAGNGLRHKNKPRGLWRLEKLKSAVDVGCVVSKNGRFHG